MLEVMPEVMSAETALIKWSEVFFIIVYNIQVYKDPDKLHKNVHYTM